MLVALTILVEGLTTDQGQVLCTLYANEATWLADPGWFATARAVPVDGRATCRFTDVPPGTYGATFLHDRNGNGDMDTNFLGLPTEPWGVSRDAPARFGPPSFADAAFVVPVSEPVVLHPK